MKPGIKWAAISLGILLFVGYIVYGSVTSNQVSCEVCLQFEDELVCRRGAAQTEEMALRAAQESTCGGRGYGMSEIIACHNRVPDRAQCTTG